MQSLASFALLVAATAPAQPAAPIQGYWKNPIGSAIIAIAPCGNALCGKVVWASARGRREVARNAPNVVGTTVLTGLRLVHGRWSGSLYIPDDNIHVSAKLQPLQNGRLKLTGCAFMGFFCRTQLWARVDGPPVHAGAS